MEYPHGRHPHHHTHHGGDRRDEENEYPPPPFYGGDRPHLGGDRRDEEYDARPHPPPFYGGNEPPPPQVYHTGHMGPGPDSYPPPFYGGDEPPPPQVYHTGHMGPGPDSYSPPPPPTVTNFYPPPPSAADHPHHHPHMPHFPPVVDHHTQHKEDELARKPSVRMYSKAETNYSLTIRDGKVILARSDPSDPFQVQLAPYNANVVDESVLWTESKDLGDSYRAIRMVNNIRLNVDAFNGDKNHGGVHDGTTIRDKISTRICRVLEDQTFE
ncbi:hypothetical protein DH2020_035291 [Rehmannia glutinosa]|uniref:Uncharacterized protein n=1 Tax=Rehmannia glutinosa TaxID=99300 RepID=A0ABR0V939_REHGL